MTQPVLIVGAGPVGMTLAMELARYGVPLRIVDKAAARTDKSKALVLWSRTLELLERGPGASRFIAAGFKVNAVNMISRDQTVGHVDMSSINSPYPFALMLPQSETERLLEERLGELGVKVERSVAATALSFAGDRVEAVLTRADGTQEKVVTPWLAGCDGAHSLVRHSVGAGFAGETLNSDWILADVHMTGYPSADTEASVYWHKDGAFVIFPISPGRYRILADQPPSDAEHPPEPSLEKVQSVMNERGPSGMRAYDPIWLAGFRINGRKVASYRWGRAFLLGDAAHVHSPAGGQGMNTGMQDAFNLAWKLALVVRGNATEQLLDSYSIERSEVGDQVLKNAGRLTTIGTLRNTVLQNLRNVAGHALLGLTAVQHAVADNLSEVSIGYLHSPLNGPAQAPAGPKPGQRFAPVDGQKPAGSGDTPRFTLMAATTPATSNLVARFSQVLDPDIRAPLSQGGLWLIRPDGYVACSATEPRSIADYLTLSCGGPPHGGPPLNDPTEARG
jgi:2-polyprenyl-6-methoxyphenol hydroxylase-like FAD-dependent oxidoreductase